VQKIRKSSTINYTEWLKEREATKIKGNIRSQNTGKWGVWKVGVAGKVIFCTLYNQSVKKKRKGGIKW